MAVWIKKADAKDVMTPLKLMRPQNLMKEIIQYIEEDVEATYAPYHIIQ